MYKTIAGAAAAIQSGELTPLELLDHCFARIHEREAEVRAWVFLDYDAARADAERLTRELREGHNRGPLHGIPIGVKDIYDVAGWPTGAGARFWAQGPAVQDSDVVARLRAAGGVFPGKTVTTAYAAFDPPVTRNPYDLQRTPGGSSSGSAVGVACGMCLGALATQTGGSTTRPAAYCGIPSLKPTFGRVSLRGVVPCAASLDHAGFFATSVQDLSILFGVVDGAPLVLQPKPPRLIVLGGMFEEKAESIMRERFHEAMTHLERASVRIERGELPMAGEEVVRQHRIVMAKEAAMYHGERFRRLPEDYPPKITELIQEGLATKPDVYHAALSFQASFRVAVDGMLKEGVLLVTPATPGPAPLADTTGPAIFNSPWSFSGHPTLSLPCGWSAEGLPLSLQLVGIWGGEEALLGSGAWCEKVLAEN